jgi:SAM-dependent methyltransferase
VHTELRVSPAAERNKKPILQVLRSLLPPTARVLEIAAGTGQHAAHFAKEQPGWQWQPTDVDATALPGIAAHSEKLTNVLPPLQLDVLAPWPPHLGLFDAVYCANMLHIAPWSTCAALMEGAASHLVDRGHLVLYGPFIVEGEPTADSNLAFDADLRQRNPQWGLRKLGMVTEAAQTMGLSLTQGVAMPANNLLLVFRRTIITR